MLDGYFELDLEMWDIAPGYLLVSEAGGIISTSSNFIGKSNKQSVLASNKFIYQALASTVSFNLEQ